MLIENLNNYPLLLHGKIVKVIEEDKRIIFMTHSAENNLIFCDCDFLTAADLLTGYQDLIKNLESAPNIIRAVIGEEHPLYADAVNEYINTPVTWILSETDYSEAKEIKDYIKRSESIDIERQTAELLNNKSVKNAAENAIKKLIREFNATQDELSALFEKRAVPLLAYALKEGINNDRKDLHETE